MKTILIAMAVLTVGSAAQASVTAGAGKWSGSGTAFGQDGKAQGDYKIELVNILTSEHSIETKGVITFPNGKTREFTQRMKDTGDKAFSIETDDGKGGGYGLGEGMVIAYIQGANGQAVAIDIAFDGTNHDQYRCIVTVLENGRAVRFLREKLTRTQ